MAVGRTPQVLGTPALGTFSRASDRIVAQLREKIMTLELPPGATVTEGYLRELLNCSQTPLREALQRLAAEQLLVAVPRKGVSVAELSIIDFTNLVESLSGIETYVGHLAATRASEKDIEELEEILSALVQAGEASDFVRWTSLDYEFHVRIAEITDNRYLVDVISRLHRLAARFTFLGLKKAGTAQGPLSDHSGIVEALRSGDGNQVEQAILAHTAHGRERMRAAL